MKASTLHRKLYRFQQVYEETVSFCQRIEKAVNPIGGTFLSRQNVKELRTITEDCISKQFIEKSLKFPPFPKGD
jgi:hypothetical protein